ncbi:MAG TPA: hypothetical protein VMC84_00230 [Methanocella sp.]|uniref:hypothetical protein n=1 Tax=Methanocella sp. TaxID=2052833 RepID=UPI002BCB4A5F|nr:hypothetical protein [Methanocella sp.]HTY89582.1 hypothetical protein [Methanocella sp.]
MPASLSLRAAGLLSASAIVAASAFYRPSPPPGDPYRSSLLMASGLILAIGSLLLSRTVRNTFLRHGGSGAFKALYWAVLASSGAGISEAVSTFYAMDVPLAASLAAVSFAGAGLMLLDFQKGGR